MAYRVLCKHCVFWKRIGKTKVGRCSHEKTIQNLDLSKKKKGRGRPPKNPEINKSNIPKKSQDMLIGEKQILTGENFGCVNFQKDYDIEEK